MSIKLRVQYKAQGRSEHIVLTGPRYVVGTFIGQDEEISGAKKIVIDSNAAHAARPIEFELLQRRPGVWKLKIGTQDGFNPYNATWQEQHDRSVTQTQTLKSNTSVLLNVGTSWTRQNLYFELIDEPLDDKDFARDIEWMEPVLTLEAHLHMKLVDLLSDIGSKEARIISSDDNEAEIKMHLMNLLKTELRSQSPEVITAIVRLAMKRGLTKFVSSENPLKGREPTEEYSTIFSIVGMRRLGGKIIQNIGLSLIVNPKSKILEDIRMLEAGFIDTYTPFESMLSGEDSRNISMLYLCRTIEDRVHRLGPLTELMELDAVNDIMVINYKEIYLDRLGRVERYPYRFNNDKELKTIIGKILEGSGRPLNNQNPIVDVRLANGSRVHAAREPVVLPLRQLDKEDGKAATSLTIRKFPEKPLTMMNLMKNGSLTQQMYTFLSDCVRLRKNIIVSGGTGSGKTTLLNCMSGFCQEGHRIVTIEDTAELRVQKPHVVTMETVKSTADSLEEYDIGALVRTALRMKPDRIFVGECRGGEAIDMLQAMNTGHSGSMTTAHANSPKEMLLRLENMVMSAPGHPPLIAIRNLIGSAVDIIIQATRFDMESDGESRRITSIAEIVGMDESGENIILEPIFEYVGHPEQGGFHAQTGYLPTFWDKLELFKSDKVSG